MLVMGKTLSDIDAERKRRADVLKIQNSESSSNPVNTEEKKDEVIRVTGSTDPVRA